MTDGLIRDRIHEALDAIEPPSGLRALGSIPAEGAPASGGRARPARFDWALGAVAALLALAIIAGLLYSRGLHQNVPSTQTVHPRSLRPLSGMVSPTVGWFIGPGGHVFRTVDGGGSWADVTPAGFDPTHVYPYFLDTDHAWLTQDSGAASTVILRTGDGGATWQRSAPITVDGLHARGAMWLYFLDATHGWMAGASVDPVLPYPQRFEFAYLYATADGGRSWKPVMNTRSHEPTCPWGGMAFSSPAVGWVTTYCGPSGGKPQLLVTRNAGATWTPQVLPAVLSDGMSLAPPTFFDAQNGFVVGEGAGSEGLLLGTRDGGQTWTTIPLPGPVLVAGAFLDPRHAWVIAGSTDLAKNDPSLDGVLAPVYQSDDGGTTWKKVDSNLPLVTPYGRIQDVYFVDQQVGFAVASAGVPYNTQASRTLYESTDAGRSWRAVGPIPTY